MQVRVTVSMMDAVEPSFEMPRDGQPAVLVVHPQLPQPRAESPPAAEPAMVPPALAAEITAVEFEEVGDFSWTCKRKDPTHKPRSCKSC